MDSTGNMLWDLYQQALNQDYFFLSAWIERNRWDQGGMEYMEGMRELIVLEVAHWLTFSAILYYLFSFHFLVII